MDFFFGDYPGSLIILGDEAQLVNLLKSNVVFGLFEIDGGKVLDHADERALGLHLLQFSEVRSF